MLSEPRAILKRRGFRDAKQGSLEHKAFTSTRVVIQNLALGGREGSRFGGFRV